MLPIQQLQELIQGKKVAFIGAGVSHKRCIEQFVELGAQVTLCDLSLIHISEPTRP